MSSFTFNTRLVIAGGALALAGGVLGAGCSADPGIDYTLLSTFCQQVAQADCSVAAVQACYGASDTALAADTTACIAVRSAPERCNPNNLPYHSDYAQPCVDAHAAVYAAPQLDPGSLKAMAVACGAVFNKGGKAGAACSADTDCALTGVADGTGLSCVIHQSKGTCQVPVQVNAGDKCSAPAAQCADGYSCDAGGHCVADPGVKEACQPGVTCASGLRCDAATSSCLPLIADTKPCTTASDCAGGFCIGTGTSAAAVCSSTFVLAFLSPTCSDFKGK